MRIDPIQLKNKSSLIIDYRNHDHKIMKYFDYSPFQDYEIRVNDLMKRTFKREEIAQVLHTMNEQWGATEETFNNIERLKQHNSVVVIGGQQAGLLTGPLYTINKIISLIQFAKEQESKLNIPVIPIFWIAGEDHDFEEINHIYLEKNKKIKKHTTSQYVYEKYPVSNIEIDQKLTKDWLREIFEQLNETKYTKQLYSSIIRCLQSSHTYVDFFAKLIYQIFHEEGLILIDSANPQLRKIESEYFIELIKEQSVIAKTVYNNLQNLTKDGYSIDLDVNKNDTHLFYHLNNERILLERTEDGKWIGKQDEVILTTDQLLTIAQNEPELLSNNVVTRPIMQELLFPTLAFVGGDGEISYWSVLKDAFHALNIKMPPVLPRLSFTYINHKTYQLLKNYSIQSEDVLNEGIDEYKISWLAAKHHPPVQKMVEQIKESINQIHHPLRDVAQNIRSDLGALSQKNLKLIYNELDYLQDRILMGIKEKYENELDHFDSISNLLFPERSLQERIVNPVYLINMKGIGFIKKLVQESCSFKNEHYLVHI